MQRNGVGAEQTRSRLLTAAAEEILARGYAAASLSRIAERMGLTKGALGHHFPTKISLIDAMMSHVVGATPAIAEAAARAFPDSPIRACVMVLGGIAGASRADAVFGAAILLFQDPSIDSAHVSPLRRSVDAMLEECLRGAVEKEGYGLSMCLADAVQFLQVILAGFLSSARFPDTFEAHQEPLFVKATLTGIGIGDAELVVDDVMERLQSA